MQLFTTADSTSTTGYKEYKREREREIVDDSVSREEYNDKKENCTLFYFFFELHVVVRVRRHDGADH